MHVDEHTGSTERDEHDENQRDPTKRGGGALGVWRQRRRVTLHRDRRDPHHRLGKIDVLLELGLGL